MRVTNQMMAGNLLRNLNSSRSRLAGYQQQISSGLRITKSSEDPTAGGEVMRIQSRLELMTQWDRNLGDAKTWARETETALAHMTELVAKSREVALAGANLGTLNDDDRQKMAIEVEAILDDMLATLNGQQTDGALFGGFETGGAPFSIDALTGAVTYAGDSGNLQRDVGPGVTITVNIHGNQFGDWTASDNVLTTLWQLTEDLTATAGPGTAAAMAANLDNLDKALQTNLALRAEVGAKDRRMEHLEMRNRETYVTLNNLLVRTQGVDMEKAIIDLNTAETTYRAALQVGARILPPTLVDFLR